MIRRFLTAAVLLAVAFPDARAQLPRSYTLRLDNDAFNFWLARWARSDDEYTSGVRIVVDNGWMPWWRKAVWTAAPRCGEAEDACVNPRAWLGQDIYNPARDGRQRQRSDARPNAGWLYYGEELRFVEGADSRSIRLTLGVTGQPSLGSFAQTLAHSAYPHLNRPIDWSRQIHFEPGVWARYERERMVVDAASGKLGAQILPSASVSLGNVRTEMTAGVRARAGLSLDNPWIPATESSRGELVLSGGITGSAVARDLFLDGNTFRDSPRVTRKPFVLTRQAGLSMRFEELKLSYNVHWNTPTYIGGPSHVWSSMVGTLQIVR